jgi:hypothetical protein
MALGKLWNALFGKRSDTETIATSNAVDRSAFVASKPSQSADSANGAVKPTKPQPGIAVQVAATERPILKTKRKAVAGKAKKTAQASALVIAAVDETPAVAVKRIPHPKKNAWSKLVAERQIASILDTDLGDASRAVELLEAIVCDAAPTPKYVAIDDFDLAGGGTTVLQFHQRVRRVGGKAVPIPGAIDEGLRQLSRTIGTVDLVLIDEANPHWQDDEIRRLLGRVIHPGTLVLCRDAKNKWNALESGLILKSAKPKVDQTQTKFSRAA